MSRRARSALLLGTAVALLALPVAGCAREPASIASTWPVASLEATVAPPSGAARFPLTGLRVPKGFAYPSAAACVKVRDSAATSAFQGVSGADVVYETADSVSGTDLACIFQSSLKGRIGPLSGAGMPELWLLPQYHAALFSAGATATVAASIKRAGLYDLSDGAGAAGLAYIDISKPASQTGTYLRGETARAEMLKLSSSIASDSARLRFSASVQTTNSATKGVSVPFSTNESVDWSYQARSNSYARSHDGHREVDAASRKQISATNVVIMWTRYTLRDQDVAGSGGYDVTLGGSGQVTVLRDGQRFDGRWKADGQSPPTFAGDDGRSIKLAPGRTWVEAIPLSMNITLR